MSYHLIVLVPIYLNETVEHVEAEIQIRTSAMDFWARIDPAGKGGDPIPCDKMVRQLRQKRWLSADGRSLLYAGEMLDRRLLPLFPRGGAAP